MEVKISASILNADWTNLGAELERAKLGGADYIHFDVMDGVFVPNISYGNVIQQSVSKITDLPIDTHLMVNDPTRLIPLFAKAGSDIITIHYESRGETEKNLELIRSLGIKTGLAVKPMVAAEYILPLLPLCDMVLIMTVEPGEGGQSFIPDTLSKIAIVRAEAERLGLDLDIQVDGGINAKTAPLVREKGANILVAGTFLFNSPDFSAAVETLKYLM